ALMAATLSLDDTQEKRVRGMVGVYGIYDLIDWWTTTQPPRRTDDPVGKLMGKTPAAAREAYESFSPLHRLRAKKVCPGPAYLIIHGDRDGIVNHNHSERFTVALREARADVESMIIPGAGHHWFTVAEDNPARRRVDQEPNVTVAPELLRFLERTLS
ncbi:MAG: prolyl oligopeptidase family serine peptidase, partial [Deltaproteobacteria bacterium]|nr:prolyl oligopeptidase family serine peptidase [Deltaproteobacteria bacterium]